MNKMAARLNLIVIRALEPLRTVEFYRALGADFQQEQHGTGPIHSAAELDGIVLEIYPAKSSEDVDRTTRLGFDVTDIAIVLDGLRSSGAEIVNDVKVTQWGLRAVVRDPDGRSVELVQRG